jgi:hypothetical protein
MSGWIENRLGQLEGRFERLLLDIDLIKQQLRAAEQNAHNAFGQHPTGGTGGSSEAFCCVLSAALPAGTPPAGGAPGTLATQTIYRITTSGYTAVGGTATVVNAMPTAGISGRLVLLVPNADGSYTAYSQACQ